MLGALHNVFVMLDGLADVNGNALYRNCPHCKTLRKATKRLSLSRLPPVLLIHLKRFSAKGPFTDKVETFVEFPLKALDLTSGCNWANCVPTYDPN